MVQYIKEEDFGAFSKGKKVESYPNELVKNVDGEDVCIIPEGQKIVFRKMHQSDVLYYIGNVNEEVYEGTIKIGGWFPTEIVCGTIRGMFSMQAPLSQECGWLQTNGSFGSKNDAFLASKVKVAAQKLEEAGFTVEFE